MHVLQSFGRFCTRSNLACLRTWGPIGDLNWRLKLPSVNGQNPALVGMGTTQIFTISTGHSEYVFLSPLWGDTVDGRNPAPPGMYNTL